MSFRGAIEKFWIGLAVVYTVYYIGYGWLPVSLTVDRVLKYYVSGYPLFGSAPLDLVVIVMLASASVKVLSLNVKKYSIIVSTYILSYTLYIFTGILQLLTLFSVSTLYLLYEYYRVYGFKKLLVDSSYTIMLLELSALISALSYFTFGSWNPILFSIVLRERFFWGFLEYASIPLLVVSGLLWFYAILKGSNHLFSKFLEEGFKASNQNLKPNSKSLLLVIPLFLVLTYTVLPHLPTVNPNFEPVSVDTFYYLRFLNYAEVYGLFEALKVFKGFARPLYLISLYFASKILNPVFLLDFLHPLISLSLLTVSVYFAVKKALGVRVALLASLLTSLGHSVLTFIAGGFQANSLALPFALLMLSVEFKDWFKLLALSLIVALIHPWTYVMFSASYAFYAWRVKRLDFKSLARTAAILLFSLGVSEVVSLPLTFQSTSSAAVKPLVGSLGFYLPANVFRGVEFWTWASQANTPIFTLASLSPITTIASPVLALTSPLLLASSSLIVHRLILNLPLEIQASTLLEKLPKQVTTLILLSVTVRGLIVLSGLTPLTGSLWRELLTGP